MKIVSSENNLHEMSKLFSGKKLEKNILKCLLNVLPGVVRVNMAMQMGYMQLACQSVTYVQNAQI